MRVDRETFERAMEEARRNHDITREESGDLIRYVNGDGTPYGTISRGLSFFSARPFVREHFLERGVLESHWWEEMKMKRNGKDRRTRHVGIIEKDSGDKYRVVNPGMEEYQSAHFVIDLDTGEVLKDGGNRVAGRKEEELAVEALEWEERQTAAYRKAQRMKEENAWRKVPGHRVEASADGRLRPLDGEEITEAPDQGGNLPVVYVRTDEGKRVPITVHRLVALAWIGTPPKGSRVAFLGTPTDASVKNLLWTTGGSAGKPVPPEQIQLPGREKPLPGGKSMKHEPTVRVKILAPEKYVEEPIEEPVEEPKDGPVEVVGLPLKKPDPDELGVVVSLNGRHILVHETDLLAYLVRGAREENGFPLVGREVQIIDLGGVANPDGTPASEECKKAIGTYVAMNPDLVGITGG